MSGSEKWRSILSILTVAAIVVVSALFGFEGADSIPNNALVYVDETKTYYSPPLIWKDIRPFHVYIPVSEVRKRGFRHVSKQPTTNQEWDEVAEEFETVWVSNIEKTWTEFRPQKGLCVVPMRRGKLKRNKGEYSPDHNHVKEGGFHGKSHSLFVHLLKLNESRWNVEGEWKW